MKIGKINMMPVGSQLVSSFRQTGFAIITGHGISPKLIEEVYSTWTEFFSKTEEFKKQFLFNPEVHDGYFPFKSENAKGYSAKDLKEFFHIYRDTELPVSDTWATEELAGELDSLGNDILTAIYPYIPPQFRGNLTHAQFANMAKDCKKTLFRILHYPPLTGENADGAVRAAAHEDINLITLLPVATQPGLEVLGTDGKWYAADADPNSIIVNVGDMLQELTGGYLKSTSHRVINPSGEAAKISRLSMPLFVHPHEDTVLSERYTAKSYLNERLRELGLK